MTEMKEKRPTVLVYCASSSQIDASYFEAAERLGMLFSDNEIVCVNGAGKEGLMGALNDTMIRNGGIVKGVIPQFMVDAGWCHDHLNETIITPTIHERKQCMAQMSDAVIALPGGVGTLEELVEIITWKQLGLYTNPVVILNINDFYRPLLDLFDKMRVTGFLKETHHPLWEVASSPKEAIALLTYFFERKASEDNFQEKEL